MKKLSKLQINSEKLMKNEELLVLRGGYGGFLICSGGEYGSCSFQVPGCEGAAEAYCPLCPGGWTSAICTGW